MAVKKNIAKKRSVSKKKGSRKAPAATSAGPTQSEFLVFSVPETVKEGAALRLVHVSKSLSDAKKHVEGLTGSKASLYAILEKKAVLLRAPVTTTSETKRNIVTS